MFHTLQNLYNQQGQGTYGFGTGMPEDVFGAFSDASSFVRPQITEEERERQFRMAMGFVPVAGTVYNWNEMGPWGRTGSVAMDALDLATFGGGKLPGAALRGLMKLAQHNPFDPKLISWRGGLPPVDEFGNPKVSTNWLTGEGEPGVSVFQGAQFPFGRGTVIRNAPDVDVRHQYPSDVPTIDPDDVFFEPVFTDTVAQVPSPASPYTVHPLAEQESILRNRAKDLYKITGDVIPGEHGAILESVLDPATMYGKPGVFRGGQFYSGVEPMPLSQFKRLSPWLGDFGPVPALGSSTGVPLASEGMSNRALKLFAQHDLQGTPLPINPQFQNAVAKWANRTNLTSTLPYTTAGRGFDWNEGDFNFPLPWNTPGQFGATEIDSPIQRAEGEGKMLSLGALP